MAEQDPQPTREQIAALAGKLHEWAKALSDEERLLLGVILARAKSQANQSASVPETIFPADDIGQATEHALRSLLQQPNLSSGARKAWVRGGDDWMQWSARQY